MLLSFLLVTCWFIPGKVFLNEHEHMGSLELGNNNLSLGSLSSQTQPFFQAPVLRMLVWEGVRERVQKQWKCPQDADPSRDTESGH